MAVPLLDLKTQYAALEKELKEALSSVMERQDFILGREVGMLEEKIAAYTGASHAIGCASGTDALLLALTAYGIGGGDEVITTPFTFFATAGSIYRTGAKIVFADIDPVTFNIDVRDVERRITKKTKAVIPVHLFGQCADMGPLMALAHAHKLIIIEDAAQAIGARHKGRSAGTIGHAGCLSFFPSKNLGGCGDGGMVLTSDAAIAEKMRLLRVHGSRDRYYHSMIGFNSRLDTLQAALLLIKLSHLDGWSEKRREHARYYDNKFEQTSVCTPRVVEGNESVYNQYTVRVAGRDALREHLKARGIGCAVYYPLALHLQECFSFLGYKSGDFPHAECASGSVLSLPVYPELTRAQLDEVASAVLEWVAKTRGERR
jgi:dTDP-4-amino-4,6-dideoxygalactose transaminase